MSAIPPDPSRHPAENRFAQQRSTSTRKADAQTLIGSMVVVALVATAIWAFKTFLDPYRDDPQSRAPISDETGSATPSSTFITEEETLRRALAASGTPCAKVTRSNVNGVFYYLCRDAYFEPYPEGTVSFELYPFGDAPQDPTDLDQFPGYGGEPVVWTDDYVVRFPKTPRGARWARAFSRD